MIDEFDLNSADCSEWVNFIGPCTCEHDPDEHGWCKCNVKDCKCEAHYEE